MKMKPWLDCVLVKIKMESVSAGGIVIVTDSDHDTIQRSCKQAYVVDYGPLVPEEAKAPIGALALIPDYSGQEFRDGEDLYKILNYDNILMLIEE